MLPKLLANKVNTIFKPNPWARIKPILGCKIKLLRQKTNTYIKTPGRGDNPQFVITGKLRYNSNKRSLLLLIFIQYTIRKCKMWSSFTHNTHVLTCRRTKHQIQDDGMMFKLLLQKSGKQLIILLSFEQKDRELGHFKAL